MVGGIKTFLGIFGIEDLQLKSLSLWLKIILVWLLVSILLNAVGLLSLSLINRHVIDLGAGVPPGYDESPLTFPSMWIRYDAWYYLDIADHGYEYELKNAGFFPLYPMLIRAMRSLTGVDCTYCGTVISSLCYLAAIYFFYKLAYQLKEDRGYAWRSVFFMVLFPSAFFFGAAYAESLTLLFSVMAVYQLYRSRPRYIFAGIEMGLASLARPVGWLLNVITLGDFFAKKRKDFKTFILIGISGVLSILGIVIYVLYLYQISGSFLAIPEAQAAWMRSWQYPWVTYFKSIQLIFQGNWAEDWFLYVINLVDFTFTTFALALTAAALWLSSQGRFKWGLSIYLLVSMLFLLAQQGVEGVPLWGMTRWVGALFPLYLVLGEIVQNKKVQIVFCTLSCLGLLTFALWWTSGRWVG